jgi:hypothetical protein
LALRWLAAPILLTLPLAPDVETPVAPPLTFDHSLDSLEQNRVITRQERLQIESGGGGVARPIDVPAFQQACRTGALSKQECREGVAVPGRDRRRGARVVLNGRDGRFTGLGRRSADGRPLPPISVPVSALLAGSTGGFRLESVFAVSPVRLRSLETATASPCSPSLDRPLPPVSSAGACIPSWGNG